MSELIYYDLKETANMTPSLPVQMARELGRRIVAGSLAQDSLIDDEAALAERYKVSRVVVREAVKLLASKGLLSVRRGIGTKVLPRSRWNLLDDDVLAWHLSGTPSPDFLVQLMDIRLAVEPKASRWAAERADDDDLENIKSALDRMAAETASENFIIADALFHKAILRAARNEILSSIEGVIYSALLVSVRITNKDPRENGASVPFHEDVYNAIADRDGDLAESLTAKLLQDANRRLKAAFSPNKNSS